MATFRYEKKDLFSMPQGTVFAHCISEDFRLGAGIAVQFNGRYNMRTRLENKCDDRTLCSYVGKAIKIDNVFNLITKKKCFEKPTYQNLQKSLEDMALQVENDNIKSLAMPKIGAGLDKLKWEIVLAIIKEVFKDIDVTITICFLEDDSDFDKCEDVQSLGDYLQCKNTSVSNDGIFKVGEDVKF